MNKIHIVFGSQGAGKSTYAKKLAKQVNGIHLAIDDWMWELYGPDLPQPMDMKWVMERVARCEKRIWATAKQIALCGGSVILDLGFMKAANRSTYVNLAAEHNILTQLHYVDAPYATRLNRVLKRNTEKGNTFSFEVSPAMFDFMEKEFEKPTATELQTAILIDTSNSQ